MTAQITRSPMPEAKFEPARPLFELEMTLEELSRVRGYDFDPLLPALTLWVTRQASPKSPSTP